MQVLVIIGRPGLPEGMKFNQSVKAPGSATVDPTKSSYASDCALVQVPDENAAVRRAEMLVHAGAGHH